MSCLPIPRETIISCCYLSTCLSCATSDQEEAAFKGYFDDLIKMTGAIKKQLVFFHAC